MNWVWLGVLVGFPLVWHLAFTAFAYTNAGRYGMNPGKWAAITFCIPLFGLFLYLFARDERTLAADAKRTVDTPYRIHPSRAEEAHDDVPNRKEDR